MSRRDKLITSIINNPKDVRFHDACKAAEWIGFVRKRGNGSHQRFLRPGEPIGLNFQNRGGKIACYQAEQLIRMLRKYREDG
jgi:hypothetical protein